MDIGRSSLSWSALTILAAGSAGCALFGGEESGRSSSSREAFTNEWVDAIHDMGKFPVMPPSEDVYVGDVYVFSEPPYYNWAEVAGGLRTAATPRWTSLEVLSQLDAEYRNRPRWSHTAETRRPVAPGNEQPGDADSLYRADRVLCVTVWLGCARWPT